MDRIAVDVFERVGQEFGIEGHGKILALVLDRNGFVRFADVRCIGRDLEVVFGKGQFDGVGFFAGKKRYPANRVQKELPLQRDAFLGLSRNHLPVIGIVALHHLGRNERRPELEQNLIFQNGKSDFVFVAQ